MGSDRREHPRVVVSLKVTGHVEAHEIAWEMTNLSLGGAFVRTEQHWPLGTVVALIIDWEGQRVATHAKVVHQHGDGLGLMFAEASAEARLALRRIVEAHAALGQPYISRRSIERTQGRIALLVRREESYGVGFTLDLSVKGALLAAPTGLVESDTLLLTLSEHGLFDCQARLARRTEAGAGLEFLSPTPEFVAAVERITDAFAGLRP